MLNRIMLVVFAVDLAWLYIWVVPVATIYATALSIPSWWGPLFPSRSIGILTWLVTVHTFAVLFSSLPFALAIDFLYGRKGVRVALTISVVVYSLTTLPSVVSFFGTSPLRLKVVTLFDAAKLVGCLPALAWGISALPSNYRIERRKEDRVPGSNVNARGAHAEP
jgi:hypothetical protein